jgi:hypothetical protein
MTKLLVALVLLTISVPLNAADRLVGTYKFNAAKSHMTGAPATAEMILVISEEGDNLVVIPSGRRVDGAALTGRLVVPKAGGTVKAPEGEIRRGDLGDAYDSAIVTRINRSTLQVVRMRQGIKVLTVKLALSPDGKTLSRSIEGTNANGQPVEGVSLLERQ